MKRHSEFGIAEGRKHEESVVWVFPDGNERSEN